jgi:hypothetical protein
MDFLLTKGLQIDMGKKPGAVIPVERGNANVF